MLRVVSRLLACATTVPRERCAFRVMPHCSFACAQPLALLGWSGCPCTNIARSRFESIGACYVQQIWPTDTAPLYKYLQCIHGAHHHSFVFVGGNFVGDGFVSCE